MSAGTAAATGEPAGREDYRALALLSLAHGVNDAYGFILQALLPVLVPLLGLSLSLAGTLVAVSQIASSVVQPWLGHLADRTNVRWFSWAGILAAGVGAALMGVAPNAVALLLLVLLSGLGAAAFHPATAAMVAGLSARSRGRMMSIYLTTGNLGLGLGPLALAPLLDRAGPSASVWLMGPAVLVAGLLWLGAPRRVAGAQRPLSLRQVFGQQRELMGKLIAVVTLRAVTWAFAAAFLPLLVVAGGQEASLGALALSLYLAMGAAGGLLGGVVSDWWGRDRVISLSLVATAPLGLLMLYGGPLGFWAGVALFGLVINGSAVVLTVRAQEALPSNIAMISGLMLGFTIGIGGLTVAPLGALADLVGLLPVFTATVLLPLPAALIVARLPKPAATSLRER